MHSGKGLLNALLQFLLLQLCNSSTTNITFDQSIRHGDLLLSHDETFVLGFFSPGTSRKRCVGIWYNFSEDMAVWVANRDDPVNDTLGILTISTDGNLVLLHSNRQGLPLWSSNVSVSPTSTTNTMAQLLDTGNLVLVNQDTNHNSVLWQSFDHPTHVLLPNMKIGMDHGKNLYLTSWNSNNDPGTGNCSFTTEPYGSPQIILYNNHAKWWRLSEPDAVFVSESPKISRRSSSDTFDIILVKNEDEITTPWAVLDHSVFSIIVISESDTSASVKQLAWQGKQQGWVVVWSAPTDVCDKYGTCGPFGVCNTHTAKTG
ncbi:putative non-specific serine/threonine protein kinase [Rosa chinensis]|uniref:Putative non-specific serine/threonine protein kinase n=1 Tax=Rosa chinensis TaxID=74649 RepID=A0A2P6Q352_ROSCH|nr:G-type lectin S-receptor-like serine/threonine-protein kinase At1g11410 [Rosa chinensis]PRQ28622.1 putative non-specific serine/threonine protein kinase [Rosa chinensis]